MAHRLLSHGTHDNESWCNCEQVIAHVNESLQICLSLSLEHSALSPSLMHSSIAHG